MDKKLLIVVLVTYLHILQIKASTDDYFNESSSYEPSENQTTTTDDFGVENSSTFLDKILSTTNIEPETSISSKDTTTSTTIKWSTLHDADYIVTDYPDEVPPTTAKTTTINPDRIITIDKDQDSSLTGIIIAIFVVVVVIFALVIGGLYAFSLFSLWF